MKIIRQAKDLQAEGRSIAVAIGMFDGVHQGHQKVLRQTLHDAELDGGMAVAVTFDKHPATILAPAAAPKLIYSLRQKLHEIEKIGFSAAWVIDFDLDFSRQPADLFVQKLLTDFGSVRSVSVGTNFSFGYQRSGNVEGLKRLGKQFGFEVHGISPVTQDHKVISSTRIRKAIASGAFHEAKEMLGRAYFISGEVIHGDQLGRKLGFPTANLKVEGLVLPPFGVYLVLCAVENQVRTGVANVGVRPTVQGESHPRLEVHFPDFSADLYGEQIEVEFVQYLRGEQKFESVEELRQQIGRDISAARQIACS